MWFFLSNVIEYVNFIESGPLPRTKLKHYTIKNISDTFRAVQQQFRKNPKSLKAHGLPASFEVLIFMKILKLIFPFSQIRKHITFI